MKIAGKYILWTIGTIIWFFFLILFRAMDAEYKSHTHQITLIVTGICLAIYIFKKTGSKEKELEKENQELKEEVQKLRQELQNKAVRQAIEKADERKSEEAKK